MKKWKTKKVKGIVYYFSKRGWKKSKFQHNNKKKSYNKGLIEKIGYINSTRRYDRIRKLYYDETESLNWNREPTEEEKKSFMKLCYEKNVDEIKLEDVL